MGNTVWAQGQIRVQPGGGGVNPSIQSDILYYDTNFAGPEQYLTKSRVTSISTNRATTLVILPSSGTLSGQFALRATP